jgi:small subunit ribosomal protein S7
MSRRRRAVKRIPPPDPKYNSVELSQFINKLMVDGKKTIAQRIVYTAMGRIEVDVKRPAMEIFNQAIQNASPIFEVRSRRVGGANYQVPTEVSPARRMALSIRWIVTAARARSGKPMADRLAQEFMEAYRGQGAAVKKREDAHRMAEANRAFVHYRW